MQITTWDLNRRKGLNMPVAEYIHIREFILALVTKQKQISLHDMLGKAVEYGVIHDNSLPLLKVKIDLEARKIIKVKIGLGPERVQLISLYRRSLNTISYE
jgi:hypothetical protein